VTFQETLDRYRRTFDESPPLLFWAGTEEALQELLEKAIRENKALTQADLMRAQGMTPGPDDAVY
jgi:hypothetical protein